MQKHIKDLLAGAGIGLACNLLGLYLCTIYFGKGAGFVNTIKNAITNDFLGKLISMGALLSLGAFFYFIKNRKDQHAKGILLITVATAITTFLIKYL